MNFEAEILEETYNDLVTIKRNTKSKNIVTGITENIEIIIGENIKCALSKLDTQTSIITSDGVGSLVFTHKLFTSPNIDVLEGDILEVSSMGRISAYLASKPFYYSSHSETLITYKERV